MATKTKSGDPAKEKKKLLITAIKKTINKNSVLPILEDILFTGKEAVLSDLESSVIIPFATPKAKGVCVPAYNFIDILEMMDNPEVVSDKNFGVVSSEGKRKVKLMGENPDNYPLIPMFNSDGDLRGGQPYADIGKVGAAEMEMLSDALSFVSGDDLRPAMTGVFFEKKGVECSKTSWMVATDAHRMFWKPISDLTESFILPAKAAKILLALGGEWSLTSNSHLEMKDGKVVYKQPTVKVKQMPEHFIEDGVTYKGNREDQMYRWQNGFNHDSFANYCKDQLQYKSFDPEDEDNKEWVEVPDPEKQPEPVFVDARHICFERKDGVKVITRVIDARFPDYRAVIPEGEGNVIATVDKEEMLKELKNAGKFANRSTNQVTLGMNGVFTIASQDVDFSFEYQNEIDGTFEIKDEKTSALTIAFNGKFLSEIINKIPKGTPVSMKMWSPTKAAIINESYLVMPLMLNQ